MAPARFHPVIAKWFAEHIGTPTESQVQGWSAIQSGIHTLIAAPTGSGKTLAAFYVELDQLFREGLTGELPNATRVVYVSPLKALSNDIHKNLEQPLSGLRKALLETTGRDIDVRAGLRTGDTSASERQAINRRPPHILVTTPESLYLLLTSGSGRKVLSSVRTVIIDEIHAVVANRRGSHLALSLERLAALVNGQLQRIGLSATQKPIKAVASFLVGRCSTGEPKCAIVDAGYQRDLDLAIEVPGSPLEAVMSNEVWTEVYTRLADLIQAHRTTLVFVNTRRLAERVTHHLCERLGHENVMSHHGSLSARLRLEAEQRLKKGELKALVATASLELGIDIGAVDLVCQIGPTRSIATLLQRVGRAEHKLGGKPVGRLFPLSRDELVECLATVSSIRQGDLDRLHIPDKPLDVLAQQMVACVACEDWDEERLFDLVHSAYPYRNLTREEFEEVVRMLGQGFSTKRGRRGGLIHHDAVNQRLRARRGSRLVALTSGGAIPDNSDYRVVLEPDETFIGTVNEDFAVESLAGDIFLLGNASWRTLRVNAGTVRVEDAQGKPPNIPFWLGEAPGRTTEVSHAVSELRREAEATLRNSAQGRSDLDGVASENLISAYRSLGGLPDNAARQLSDYFAATYRALGTLPSQHTLVMERFFDESGGMQLVIHSPFGIRINRGWGLALRKRFCRAFNFELQAAATDDAIVLSLGTQHSFPLDEVFHYLNSKTVRALLVQALLDSPMFPVRWRWNATRALALPRQRGGHKVPAPLQRMEAENLLAAVFPDQLACLENISGDREIPDHPLVRQTIADCLTEAMDIDGLEALLRKIETGEIKCIARDLPEPSPLAHEILNARPYAFLDNAPLEERRTHAVYTRRASESPTELALGLLDPAAIAQVCSEAWPRITNPEELHDALLISGFLTSSEIETFGAQAVTWMQELVGQRRAGLLTRSRGVHLWIAAERLPLFRQVFPEGTCNPQLRVPEAELRTSWERPDAVRELVRGRMEISGPVTESSLLDLFRVSSSELKTALLALEGEGFVLRGHFRSAGGELEWCDRRLLARIHRLTLNRLRSEIQPVSLAEFQRFLVIWQRVAPEHRAEGPEGLRMVLETLDGYEIAAAAWEPDILASRVKDYSPQWLDQLCYTGQFGWGRLRHPRSQNSHPTSPIRSTPISLFLREHLADWLALSPFEQTTQLGPDVALVLERFQRQGALFFGELLKQRSLLPSRVEEALAELAAQGCVTSDSFEGLRALLLPRDKRIPFINSERRRRHKAVSSVEYAGRWSLLRGSGPWTGDIAHRNIDLGSRTVNSKGISNGRVQPELPQTGLESGTVHPKREESVEVFARVLLRRYGIVFRTLIQRESIGVSWYELGRVFRRLEARGQIRGGYFVGGVGGEQFALPEAVGRLRSTRGTAPEGQLVVISGADPLNLAGILSPGKRIPAIASNRVLLRDGVPAAALKGRQVLSFESEAKELDGMLARKLRVGALPVSLRPYYG